MDTTVHVDGTPTVSVESASIIDAAIPTTYSSNKAMHTVESSTNVFSVVPKGFYSGNLSGNIPTWLDEAVTQAVANGTVSLSQAIADLNTYVNSIDEGVRQSISNINNATEKLNGLITTVKTESEEGIAAISDVLVTKVTADEASAISQTVVGSVFSGDGNEIVNSWLINSMKTYTDATTANTTTTNMLVSAINNPNTGLEATAANIAAGYATVGLNSDGTLNSMAGELGRLTATAYGIEARLITSDGVASGKFEEWDETSDPKIGMIHTEPDGTIFQYFGGSYDEGYQIGWKKLDKNIFRITSDLNGKIDAIADGLQNQLDGNITTWFFSGSPEFSENDADFVSSNNEADLTAGSLIWSLVDRCMFVYNGDDNTVDLTTVTFVTDTDYTPVYKLNNADKDWYADDNVDTSYGYVWYVDDSIQPVLDTTVDVSIVTRVQHVGDLYYDRITGYAYRFAYEDLPDDTPDRGTYFSWIKITDVDITKALADAAQAQDTADSKRRVFGGSYLVDGHPYTPYDEGDLWAREFTEGTEMWKSTVNRASGESFNEVDWVKVSTDTVVAVWAAGASKLITDPNTGAITGWSFADGSAIASEFVINADTFYINSSSNPSYKPFVVDGDLIKFNGYVSFDGLGINSYSTTIDGGLIETNTLNADTIKAGSTITSPVVVGGKFIGGVVSGTILQTSYKDYRTSLLQSSLTNHQFSEIPNSFGWKEELERYVFAKDTEGNLLKDYDDMFRIPTTESFTAHGRNIDVIRSLSEDNEGTVVGILAGIYSSSALYHSGIDEDTEFFEGAIFGNRLIHNNLCYLSNFPTSTYIELQANTGNGEYQELETDVVLNIFGKTLHIHCFVEKKHYADLTTNNDTGFSISIDDSVIHSYTVQGDETANEHFDLTINISEYLACTINVSVQNYTSTDGSTKNCVVILDMKFADMDSIREIEVYGDDSELCTYYSYSRVKRGSGDAPLACVHSINCDDFLVTNII